MIHIADADPSRCKAAAEFLDEGKGISIGDYWLRLVDGDSVEVGVVTQWPLADQTEESQAKEISQAKRFFRETVAELPFLGEMLAGRKFAFYIAHSDGKNGVALSKPTPLSKI